MCIQRALKWRASFPGREENGRGEKTDSILLKTLQSVSEATTELSDHRWQNLDKTPTEPLSGIRINLLLPYNFTAKLRRGSQENQKAWLIKFFHLMVSLIWAELTQYRKCILQRENNPFGNHKAAQVTPEFSQRQTARFRRVLPRSLTRTGLRCAWTDWPSDRPQHLHWHHLTEDTEARGPGRWAGQVSLPWVRTTKLPMLAEGSAPPHAVTWLQIPSSARRGPSAPEMLSGAREEPAASTFY